MDKIRKQKKEGSKMFQTFFIPLFYSLVFSMFLCKFSGYLLRSGCGLYGAEGEGHDEEGYGFAEANDGDVLAEALAGFAERIAG